jgi:hypothetical protein
MSNPTNKDVKAGSVLSLLSNLTDIIQNLGDDLMRFLGVMVILLFISLYVFKDKINPNFGIGVMAFVILSFGLVLMKNRMNEKKIDYLSKKEDLYKQGLRDTVFKLYESENSAASKPKKTK